jgi:hypothetical protein
MDEREINSGFPAKLIAGPAWVELLHPSVPNLSVLELNRQLYRRDSYKEIITVLRLFALRIND